MAPQTGSSHNKDPKFVDPSHGNYRLLPSSPAVNAGDNFLPAEPTVDVEGNPRVAGVDLGATNCRPHFRHGFDLKYRRELNRTALSRPKRYTATPGSDKPNVDEFPNA